MCCNGTTDLRQEGNYPCAVHQGLLASMHAAGGPLQAVGHVAGSNRAIASPLIQIAGEASILTNSTLTIDSAFAVHVRGRGFALAGYCSKIVSPVVTKMRGGPVLGALSVMDTDTESQLSYASGPKSIKPTVKVAWKGGKKVSGFTMAYLGCNCMWIRRLNIALQVDEENFLHMQEEYYRLKQAEKANEETMRQYVLFCHCGAYMSGRQPLI